MPPVKVSEKQFQSRVIDLLHLHGYRVSHFMPALNARGNWRTPVAADGKGFPDLVAVRAERAGRAGRLLFVELKSDTGRVAQAQREWHRELESAGADVYVWRPKDWNTLAEIVR